MPLLPLWRRDEIEQLAAGVVLGLDGEADIGPVEALHHGLDAVVEKLQRDVGARDFVRRRGQRDDRDAAETYRASFVSARYSGPERRAPLRDAMRLVDGDQPDGRA